MRNSQSEETLEDYYKKPFGSLCTVNSIVQKIFNRAFDNIYSNWVENQLLFFSTVSCTNIIHETAKLFLAKEDVGDQLSQDLCKGHEWAPSKEPSAPEPDTCAVGKLSVHKDNLRILVEKAEIKDEKKRTRSHLSVGRGALLNRNSRKEERKVMIYELSTEKPKDPLENLIEEKRQLRHAEERKLFEEKHKEIVGKKKLAELRERHKTEGKTGKAPPTYFSYDPKGHSVEPINFQKLPIINPKCIASPCNCQPTEGNSQNDPIPAIQKPVHSQKDILKSEPYKVKLASNKNEQHGAVAPYEILTPAAGVTFTENGKNPKASLETVLQKSGKPNKSTFYASLADSAMRVSASLPSLFPLNEAQPTTKHKTESTVEKLSYNQMVSENSSKMQSAENSTVVLGDMSSLIVEYKSMWPQKQLHDLSSIRPQPYIPPSFRRHGSSGIASQGNSPRVSRLEASNVELLDNSSSSKSRLAPIVIAKKVYPKGLKRSVRLLKRFPRDVSTRYLISTKLPPPPLGRTLGHGIFQA